MVCTSTCITTSHHMVTLPCPRRVHPPEVTDYLISVDGSSHSLFSFLYKNNQVDWINKSNSQTMFIPLYPTQREMNHVWAGCLRCLEAEEVSPVPSPGRRHESPSLARGWQTSQLGRGGSDCQYSGKCLQCL